jgi:diguanylate cyclase
MHDFTAASRRALKFLQQQFGFKLWMVTRVENENWIVLSAEDNGYGVKDGARLNWSHSICSRMVQGLGPKIAPNVDAVPAYAGAPIRLGMKIGSYVGIPIKQADGTLFGTLCAMSPETQSPDIAKHMEFLTFIADMLTLILNTELRAVSIMRRFERAVDDAMTDPLTSLYNRRGWIKFLSKEEERCRRYGHSACVLSIDIDNLKQENDRRGHASGDELIKSTGRALFAAVRTTDFVARTGGDEFMVLCVECDVVEANVIANRIRSNLLDDKITASVGLAMRHTENGLYFTADLADQEMYKEKRSQKARSSAARGLEFEFASGLA